MEGFVRTQLILVKRIENAIAIFNTNSGDAELMEELGGLIDSLRQTTEDVCKTCSMEEVETNTDRYLQLHTAFVRARKTFNASSTEANSQTQQSCNFSQNPQQRRRLPEIVIPTFSGVQEEWNNFIQLFNASIHVDPDLTKIEKLQYLKGFLRGDAAGLVLHMPLTDDGYDEAYQLVVAAYQHERRTVYSHCSEFINQASATNDRKSLQDLVNISNRSMKALDTLGQKVDFRDSFTTFILLGKLPQELRKEWEIRQSSDKIPPFADVIAFIQQRANSMMSHAQTSVPGNDLPSVSSKHPTAGASSSNTQFKRNPQQQQPAWSSPCKLCNQEHSLMRCQQFAKMAVSERLQVIRHHKLCFNCMRPGHPLPRCPTQTGCKECGKKHHTMLHLAQSKRDDTAKVLHSTEDNTTVLLGTAEVLVQDSQGGLLRARTLLDAGAQASFISQRLMQRLGIASRKTQKTFGGFFTTSSQPVRGAAEIKISNGTESWDCTAYIRPTLASILPSVFIQHREWEHIRNLRLADPQFYKPREIDLLLGADIMARIVRPNIIQGAEGTPAAMETVFGWILMGPTSLESPKMHHAKMHFVHEEPIHQSLQRFWEVESIPTLPVFTQEEEQAESHFIQTHQIQADGRFEVRIPFKQGNPDLGTSEHIATSRFLALERRFHKEPAFAKEYARVMQDYIEQGHMAPLNTNSAVRRKAYLPHHGVLKSDSSTTKLRVVFDASVVTSNGHSLNDAMLLGPRTQDDLLPILLRFRTFQHAFSADITQMYRQIKLHPEDQDFQRIVWRADSQAPVCEFKLTTVSFGTKAAPFLATRVLNQLAANHEQEFPKAAIQLRQNFYVDNFLGGANSIEDARNLVADMNNLLQRGKFHLRKWASNCPAALASVPIADREMHSTIISNDECIKTLGIRWNHVTDSFTFHVRLKQILLEEAFCRKQLKFSTHSDGSLLLSSLPRCCCKSCGWKELRGMIHSQTTFVIDGKTGVQASISSLKSTFLVGSSLQLENSSSVDSRMRARKHTPPWSSCVQYTTRKSRSSRLPRKRESHPSSG